ncbi:hypothetical protein CEXT_25411, partial [Caerostris extrusa]
MVAHAGRRICGIVGCAAGLNWCGFEPVSMRSYELFLNKQWPPQETDLSSAGDQRNDQNKICLTWNQDLPIFRCGIRKCWIMMMITVFRYAHGQ